MPEIISVHHYSLRPGVDGEAFERALRSARESGLLRLPGLIEQRFLRGVKGSRQGSFAALWVYESREAWERLWGSAARPRPRKDYPENWKVWEKEILAPFLDREPDRIEFTAYEAF